MNPLTKTLTLAAVALAIPASASAATIDTFPSEPISPEEINNPGGQHGLGIEPDGDASVLWGNNSDMRMANRAGGAASFGAPFNFSNPGDTTNAPEFATGADGQSIAVWREANPQQVWVSIRPSGGSYTQAVQVSNELLPVPNVDPQVAALPGGRALVVWTGHNNGDQAVIRAREVNADGGIAGNPISTLSTPFNHFPDVATDSAGNALVGWKAEDNTLSEVRYRRANGTLEAPTPLALDTGGHSVAPSFDPQGRAFVMFREDNEFRVRVRPAGDGQLFAAPDVLDDVGIAGSSPTPVGFDASGRATAVVGIFQGGKWTVRTATRQPGDATSFTDLAVASDPDANVGNGLSASVAPGGEAVAAWKDGTSDRVRAMVRQAGATTFEPSKLVSPEGREANELHTAIGADGQGLISLASRVGNAPQRIEVAPVRNVPVADGGQGAQGSGQGNASNPAASRDTTAPVISRAGLSRKRFAIKKRGKRTKVRFTLSEAASVRMTFERKVRVRGKTRMKGAGSLDRKNLKQGKQQLTLPAKIGRKALKPGKYTLTLRATDAAGNRSKAAKITFTVKRR